MLCPKCHAPIELTTGVCTAHHAFSFENGVLCLLDDALRARLDSIYQHRVDVTAQLPLIDDYNRLPYALADQHFEWRLRAYDADIVLKILRNLFLTPNPSPYDGEGRRGGDKKTLSPQPSTLEIGAWNGWLTHHLVRAGCQVTAIDYFAHDTDGLGAKSRYDGNWQAIDWQAAQMNITDLSLFDERFDVIVVNHGLHFFPDPVGYLGQLKRLLTSNGVLIVIGLTFYRDPTQRIQQVRQLESLFINPTRGYLEMNDYAGMQAQGVTLKRDPRLWRAHLKAAINPQAPLYAYGIAYAAYSDG